MLSYDKIHVSGLTNINGNKRLHECICVSLQIIFSCKFLIFGKTFSPFNNLMMKVLRFNEAEIVSVNNKRYRIFFFVWVNMKLKINWKLLLWHKVVWMNSIFLSKFYVTFK